MTVDLDWWEVRGAFDFLVGAVPRFTGMGAGWERVIELAHDSISRPHDSSSSDRLRLECREMAEMLATIVAEDGHTLTLAECLRAIVLDVAAREPRAVSA